MTTTVATCRNDHPLVADNVYTNPSDGRRRCRECRRERRGRGRRPSHGRARVETLTRVPNAPLRERFLAMEAAGEVTANSLALALEWRPPPNRATPGRGDTQRVRRSLGLVENRDGKGPNGERTPTIRRTVKYETAVKIAFALGMDPWEAGV